MSHSDHTYFTARAAEEDFAAITAASAAARDRHSEMARMYRDRIRFGSLRYGELPIETVAPLAIAPAAA